MHCKQCGRAVKTTPTSGSLPEFHNAPPSDLRELCIREKKRKKQDKQDKQEKGKQAAQLWQRDRAKLIGQFQKFGII